MSELTQSVVVSNLDGRIPCRATTGQSQFKAMSDAPQVAGGGELIGLERSIYHGARAHSSSMRSRACSTCLRRGAASQ